jgi:hypothetical protein
MVFVKFFQPLLPQKITKGENDETDSRNNEKGLILLVTDTVTLNGQ